MKKIKIKQRFENAVDAFLADNHSTKNDSISFADDSNLLRNELTADSSEKSAAFGKILKQVFLFFPGTFVLFIISFGCTVISISNPFNATMPLGRVVWVALLFLGSIFMTWHGIGNLRKPKHFIIPVSIIITGFVLGAVSGLMSVLFHQLRSLIWNDAYPLYFLALALIVPFLAKGWVDGTSES